MKEHKGKLFKVKPEDISINIHDITFRLLDVDDDECCSIEWIQDEPRISRIYKADLEYFFKSGRYYWV